MSVQELNKTVDLNFKVGMPQWVLAQPLWYPLLVVCAGLIGFGWLFGVVGLFLGITASTIISFIIILFGIESQGISLFSLIRSYISYQLSKKILLKKEIHQKTERVQNNCTITRNYIFNQADINSQEFSDTSDKDKFEKDLEGIINRASKDDLTYVITTELTRMQKEDITDYLEFIRLNTPENYSGAFLALALDLSALVENGEFNQVKSRLTLSLPTDRKENLNLQIKTLNNELQLLERKSQTTNISIRQTKLDLK
jgi:hypothetical protein